MPFIDDLEAPTPTPTATPIPTATPTPVPVQKVEPTRVASEIQPPAPLLGSYPNQSVISPEDVAANVRRARRHAAVLKGRPADPKKAMQWSDADAAVSDQLFGAPRSQTDSPAGRAAAQLVTSPAHSLGVLAQRAYRGPQRLFQDVDLMARGILREALGSTYPQFLDALGAVPDEVAHEGFRRINEANQQTALTERNLADRVFGRVGEFSTRELPKIMAAQALTGGASSGFAALSAAEGLSQGEPLSTIAPNAAQAYAMGKALEFTHPLALPQRSVAQGTIFTTPTIMAGGSPEQSLESFAEGALLPFVTPGTDRRGVSGREAVRQAYDYWTSDKPKTFSVANEPLGETAPEQNRRQRMADDPEGTGQAGELFKELNPDFPLTEQEVPTRQPGGTAREETLDSIVQTVRRVMRTSPDAVNKYPEQVAAMMGVRPELVVKIRDTFGPIDGPRPSEIERQTDAARAAERDRASLERFPELGYYRENKNQFTGMSEPVFLQRTNSLRSVLDEFPTAPTSWIATKTGLPEGYVDKLRNDMNPPASEPAAEAPPPEKPKGPFYPELNPPKIDIPEGGLAALHIVRRVNYEIQQAVESIPGAKDDLLDLVDSRGTPIDKFARWVFKNFGTGAGYVPGGRGLRITVNQASQPQPLADPKPWDKPRLPNAILTGLIDGKQFSFPPPGMAAATGGTTRAVLDRFAYVLGLPPIYDPYISTPSGVLPVYGETRGPLSDEHLARALAGEYGESLRKAAENQFREQFRGFGSPMPPPRPQGSTEPPPPPPSEEPPPPEDMGTPEGTPPPPPPPAPPPPSAEPMESAAPPPAETSPTESAAPEDIWSEDVPAPTEDTIVTEAPTPPPTTEELAGAQINPDTGKPEVQTANGETITTATADEIQSDPNTFQYKRTGSRGVTSALDEATTFNPAFGGMLTVWRSPNDGQLYVVNGHHRLDLAKRTNYKGPLTVKILNSPTAKEARAAGAMENIAEGRGTTTDAATLFRDMGYTRDNLKTSGLSFSDKKIMDAVNMASLADPLFRKVANGQWPESRGIIIGAGGLSEDQQIDLMKYLSAEDEPRLVDDALVKEIVTMAQSAKAVTRDMFGDGEDAGPDGGFGDGQPDLFGTGSGKRTNLVEKAGVIRAVKQRLNAVIFSTRTANNYATDLEDLGNVINTENNAGNLDSARQIFQAFNSLAPKVGPLGDLLQAGADRVTAGENPNNVADSIFPEIVQHLKDALPGLNTRVLEGALRGRGAAESPEAPGGRAGQGQGRRPRAGRAAQPEPAAQPEAPAPEPVIETAHPPVEPPTPPIVTVEPATGSPDSWTGTEADWSAGGKFREGFIQKFTGKPGQSLLDAEYYDFRQPSNDSRIKFAYPKRYQKQAVKQLAALREQGATDAELNDLRKYLREDLTRDEVRRFPHMDDVTAKNWVPKFFRIVFQVPRKPGGPRGGKGGGEGDAPPSPPAEGQGQAKPFPGRVTRRGRRSPGETSTATVDVFDPDGSVSTYEVPDTAPNGNQLRDKQLREQAWNQHVAAVTARMAGQRGEKAAAQVRAAMVSGNDPRLTDALRSGKPIPEHELRTVLADNGIDPELAPDIRKANAIPEPPAEVPAGHAYITSTSDGFIVPRSLEPLRNVVADSWHGSDRFQTNMGFAGPGRYTYPARADAEEMGPKVDAVRVSLKKPFIVRNRTDLELMLRKASIDQWTTEDEAILGMAKLRRALDDWDYDGLVLSLDKLSREDPLLRLAFVDTRDQIVEFNEDPRKLAPDARLPAPPPGMPPDLAAARLSPQEIEAARNSRGAQRFRYLADRTEFTGANEEVSPVDLVSAYRYNPMDPNNIPIGGAADVNSGPDGVDPRNIITRRQIAEELGSRIDATFRSGKLRNPKLGITSAPPGLRGWYAHRLGYGRVRSLRDIGVLAHEFGHAIDSLLFAGLPHEDGVVNPATEMRKPGQKRFRPDPATWTEWAAELDPLAVGVSGGDHAEGMAQFVSHYVTNRAYAKAAAPKFFKYFEETMAKRAPEILETLQSAGDKFQSYWNEMSPMQRATASLSTGVRPRVGTGIKGTINDILRQYFRRNQPFHNMVNTVEGTEKRNWWGKRIPYSNLLAIDNPAILEQNLGATSAGVVRSWLTGEGQISADGQYQGRSLKDIWSPYEGDPVGFEKFGNYCLAKRTLEVARNGIKLPLSVEDAKHIVDEVEASDPRAVVVHDEQALFQNNLARYLADHGVVSKAKVEELIENFKDYVPVYAVLEAFERTPGSGDQPSASSMGAIYNPIRHMKGGDRDRINPLEGIVKNAMTFINLAHRNEVAKSLYRIGSREGGGEFVRHLPTPLEKIDVDRQEVIRWIKKRMSPPLQIALEAASGAKLKELLDAIIPMDMLHVFRATRYNPNEPILSAFFDGKEHFMEVNPDIYEVAHGLPRKQFNAVIRALGIPARFLRAGATGINVEFVTKNLLRDQIFGHINSRYLNLPGVNAVRGLYHMLGRTDEYKEFLRSGLDGVARVSMDRDSIARETDKLINATRGDNVSKTDKFKDGVTKTLTSPIDFFRFISERGEMISRLGALAEARKIEKASGYVPGKGNVGISEETIAGTGPASENSMRAYRELTLRSAMAARESTVDFSMMGASDLTQLMSTTTAFWNARLQGTARSVRSFQEDPLGTTLKVAAFVTLPTLMHYIYSKDDGQLADRPAWERRMFWLIPTKVIPTAMYRKMQREDPRGLADYVEKYPVVRVPKPEFYGDLGGTLVEDTLEYMEKKNPKRFWEDMRAFRDDVANIAAPTILSVPWAIASNKDSLTNRPVVPKQFANINVDPSEMYTINTSPTAISVARAYNGALPSYAKDRRITPMALEYAVRGWGGAVGYQILNIADFARSWSDGTAKDKALSRPETYWREIPVFRSFFSRHPSSSAEPIQDFWDLYGDIKEAHDTPRFVGKAEPSRAVDYIKQHPDFALVYSDIEERRKKISEINSMLRMINKSPGLDPKAKRQALDAGTLYLIGQCREAADDAKAKMAVIRDKIAQRKP